MLSRREDRLTYVFGSRAVAKAPEICYTAEFIMVAKYENSHKRITRSMEASKMNSIFDARSAGARHDSYYLNIGVHRQRLQIARKNDSVRSTIEKRACVFLAIVVASASAVPVNNTSVPIVAYTADGPNPDGSYSFSYEAGNGIKAEEHGQLKQVNETHSVVAVQGSYSYSVADGSPVALSYVADENGFQPKGEHLPTPHPIPEGILKALEYIAAHPEQDETH
ncbi:PREDICTED: larval cuticle protein LCP-17-like [Habropoda laboriosa]|uniref:larval cuticle protein LCP-17-like n=1 Tax=Habropoda laboriosa TaxID=597456 RepID=UPI00083DD2D7|nr:PREDICTED: larval cuticle protein LCP-17-like [Habropoda laboriosa]